MRPVYLPLTVLLTAAVVAAPAKKTPPKKAPAKPKTGAAKPKPAPAPKEDLTAVRELQMGGVKSSVPGAWLPVNPDGQFRAAQYAIPKAGGDTAPAMFIVFHFGAGGGGGVEDNVQRWAGMIRQPDGRDTAQVMKREVAQKPGLRITHVDIPGTYLERPFPRSTEFTERPNYRMLAAIIETTEEGGDGPYFVRLVGPEKSVTAAKKGWDDWLLSLKWQ